MKRSTWKQPTPIDQLTAIRGALEGNVINFDSGIIRKWEIVDRALKATEEIRELEPFLRGDQPWTTPSQL